MNELKTALMESQDYDEYEAEREIKNMRKRVKYGENPEEILSEYGLEIDYVFELLL